MIFSPARKEPVVTWVVRPSVRPSVISRGSGSSPFKTQTRPTCAPAVDGFGLGYLLSMSGGGEKVSPRLGTVSALRATAMIIVAFALMPGRKTPSGLSAEMVAG